MEYIEDDDDLETGLDNDMTFSLSSESDSRSITSDTSTETCDTPVRYSCFTRLLAMCQAAPAIVFEVLVVLIEYIMRVRVCRFF